ncbi:MAG: DMT family transporter, partial [Actinomycetota bacterium]|nr:DMT family transporter [Actinomycetota bacterium]
TYTAAGVLVLAACIAGDVPLTGYDGQTWGAIAAILIGPQLLGHTILNLVVKDIGATTVSVAIMAEPPIAVALGFVLFAEAPSLLVYPGGVAILIGIFMVSRSRIPTPVLSD